MPQFFWRLRLSHFLLFFNFCLNKWSFTCNMLFSLLTYKCLLFFYCTFTMIEHSTICLFYNVNVIPNILEMLRQYSSMNTLSLYNSCSKFSAPDVFVMYCNVMELTFICNEYVICCTKKSPDKEPKSMQMYKQNIGCFCNS